MKKSLIFTLLMAFAFLCACSQKDPSSSAKASDKSTAVKFTDQAQTESKSKPEELSDFELADKYYFGKDGYEQDYKKAFELFNKIHEETKDIDGFYAESCAEMALGNMYYHGYGVKKDIKKAFELWNWHDGCSVENGNNIYSFEAYKNIRDYIIENKDKNLAFEKGDACFQRDEHLGETCGHSLQVDDDNRYNCTIGEVWYKLAAELGDSEAKLRLAMNYLEPQNIHFNCYMDITSKENQYEGERLLLSAAEQGYVDAMEELGNLYFYGWSDVQNYREAEKWFLKAASKGKGYSALMLARIYSGGMSIGLPADYQKAYRWANMAVQKGLAEGNYYLGLLYYNGNVVPKDRAKALSLFKKAGDGGTYEWLAAGKMLQKMYLNEEGTESDFKSLSKEDDRCYYYYCAKGWIFGKDNYAKKELEDVWQAAFENDDIWAQIYLMDQYAKNTEDLETQETISILKALIALHKEPKDEYAKKEWKRVKKLIADESKNVQPIKDYEKASREELIKSATLKNDVQAQLLLGEVYIDKYNGVERHPDIIGLMFNPSEESKKALKHDHDQFKIQEEFLTGAAEWYFLAARSGNDTAQVQLASMYGNRNIGTYAAPYDPHNMPEEIYWLEKAVAQGNHIAEYALANKYHDGVAFYDEVGAIYSFGFNLPYLARDLKKAYSLYKKSAQAGFVPAMKKLGDMYEHGEYVEQDKDLKEYWDKKATETKDETCDKYTVNFYINEKSNS